MLPALPFIAYTTVYFMDLLSRKIPKFIYVFGGLFLFTFIRHKFEYYKSNPPTSIISENEILLKSVSEVYFISSITPQQELIYDLYIKSNKALFAKDISVISAPALCLSKLYYWEEIHGKKNEKLELIAEKDNLVLFKVKE